MLDTITTHIRCWGSYLGALLPDFAPLRRGFFLNAARTSEQVSGGGTTDPKAGTAVEPLQRQLQAQHDLVAANEVPNGAAASFQRGKSSDVIIPAVVLRRPVVVGFRSVRWKPQRSP